MYRMLSRVYASGNSLAAKYSFQTVVTTLRINFPRSRYLSTSAGEVHPWWLIFSFYILWQIQTSLYADRLCVFSFRFPGGSRDWFSPGLFPPRFSCFRPACSPLRVYRSFADDFISGCAAGFWKSAAKKKELLARVNVLIRFRQTASWNEIFGAMPRYGELKLV